MAHAADSIPSCVERVERFLRLDALECEARAAFEEMVRSGAVALVMERAPHHRIGPILAARLREFGDLGEQGPGRAPAERLNRIADSNVFRNRLLRAQLAEAVSLLAERGIPVCLMKGAVSLADAVPEGYLTAAERRTEDLDIVVRPEDGESARAAMAERGWLCTWGEQPMPALDDAAGLVDVHAWSRGGAEVGCLPREEFFGHAERGAVCGREVGILAPERHVQLRLVHNVIRQQLFIDFPLADLYEVARIIRSHRERIDWAGLRGVALRHDAGPVFDAVLLRLRDELGAPVPDDAVPRACRATAERMRRRMESLSRAPGWLYGAACRAALVSASPCGGAERFNRAVAVLVTRPMAESGRGALRRAVTPVRTGLLHAAVRCWEMMRG